MLTTTRRRVAGAALSSSALLALLAVPATAQAAAKPAAAVTWRSTVMGTVSTWHCSAELIAHVASNNKFDASGQMTVHSASQFAGHGDCDYQVLANSVPVLWRPDIGFNWFSSGSRTYTSGWVADNGATTVKVCLSENYSAPHYAAYHSGLRCTRSW